MLAALDRELGIEAPDPAKIAQDLKTKINEQLQLTLHFKKAGDDECRRCPRLRC